MNALGSAQVCCTCGLPAVPFCEGFHCCDSCTHGTLPDYTPNADTLSEHVIDRHGLVWRIVRDGGMATRAHFAGIVSIGIHTLERKHGPLRTVQAGHVIPPGSSEATA